MMPVLTSSLAALKNDAFKTRLILLSLIFIYLAGVHLRVAYFDDWQAMGEVYKYQQEYQMVNYDSYYYLLAARALQNEHYDQIDQNRRVPTGMARPWFVPLSSWMAATLADISGLPLATLAIFFPVFLAPLLVFVVYAIARSLGLSPLSGLVAATLSIFSYTYVFRTQLGVFDTDCLNVVLLCLNTFWVTKLFNDEGAVNLKVGLALLVSTFLFSIWWNTAVLVAVFSTLIPLGLTVILNADPKMRYKYLLMLAVLTGLVLVFQHRALLGLISTVLGLGSQDFVIVETIQELEKVSLDAFAKGTTGHLLLLLPMVLGLSGLLVTHFSKAIFYIVPISFCFFPLFMGNRFMIFSAPMLALGAAYWVHLLSEKSFIYKSFSTWVLAILIVIAVVWVSYPRHTGKPNKPAVHESRILLDAIAKHTETNANIWTNWSLGYQINYYLNRGTYVDGDLVEGAEVLTHVSLPLASDNIRFAANFIKFYTHQDMKTFYKAFDSNLEAIEFLQAMLSLKPDQAEEEIVKRLAANQIKQTQMLPDVDAWLEYLFVRAEKPMYLLLHQKMMQTVSWFKQGKYDLETGKLNHLPLFLQFNGLQEEGRLIGNKNFLVNTDKGMIKQRSSGNLQVLQALQTCDHGRCQTQYYNEDNEKIPKFHRQKNAADDRFVFAWRADLGYGALFSKAMYSTLVSALYLGKSAQGLFEPVVDQVPHYQLWRVLGDTVESR